MLGREINIYLEWQKPAATVRLTSYCFSHLLNVQLNASNNLSVNSEVASQVILHASVTPLLQLLQLLNLLSVMHVLDINLVLYLVVDELILLLSLVLHLHRNLCLESCRCLWHSRVSLLLDELEERP